MDEGVDGAGDAGAAADEPSVDVDADSFFVADEEDDRLSVL